MTKKLKITLIIITIIILSIIGAGVYYYFFITKVGPQPPIAVEPGPKEPEYKLEDFADIEMIETELFGEMPIISMKEEVDETEFLPGIDTDMDGWTNDQEKDAGTDPWKKDTDDDGIIDPKERIYNTDPLDADTDGDGYNDGDELKQGYDPARAGKKIGEE